MDLLTIMDKCNDDEKYREALEKIRWPNGVACTRCGVLGAPELPGGVLFQCKSCRYQLSVTSGTIMHDYHPPLRKWFLAIYLVCESKKGISANQLRRTIGTTYRTAWHLCHRIRKAMVSASRYWGQTPRRVEYRSTKGGLSSDYCHQTIVTCVIPLKEGSRCLSRRPHYAKDYCPAHYQNPAFLAPPPYLR